MTDGASELPLKRGGRLGLSGFKSLLQRHASLNPAELLKKIKAELLRKGLELMEDDVTLLAAKRV